MSIVELLEKIGSNNIAFQNLDECSIAMDYNAKKGTVIKFGTNEKINMDGTLKLGLIVWVDRDKVKSAIESVAQQHEPIKTDEQD